MNTLCDARRKQFIKRLLWTTVVLASIYLILQLTSDRFGAILEAIIPPKLPQAVQVDKQVWLEQNWSPAQNDKFHHISQGTRTIPVPYDWFVNLEQPSSSLIGILWSSDNKFIENDHLLRFGFIRSKQTTDNPDGLPVGFAKTVSQQIPGLSIKADAIGLTCAACHTGQINYEGTQYVIEGGPAQTDLGLFTATFGAALAQTALSSKIPFFNGRFERFAKNVLKNEYSDATKLALADDMAAILLDLKQNTDVIDVTEGFARLDALNRIGNQVFAEDLNRRENYVPISAPVNYPHIWTSSWFSWVQYDGSIMQPLVRNAGEALGVNAYLDVKSPHDQNRFASSIPIDNLVWIESALAGEPPYPNKRLSGLLSPKWPETLPAIDQQRWQRGAALYQENCQGCHLPPLNSEEIWSDKYFSPIVWKDADGAVQQTAEQVLKVKIIPHSQIGTDSATGDVLATRTVDTSGQANLPSDQATPGMGLDAQLCTWAPTAPLTTWETGQRPRSELVTVPFTDGGEVLFALALGATVQQTIDAWYQQNYISDELRTKFQGDRPNCLQAGKGYKARPLNGIWATAPYLHNGSVPNLMALLSPVEERPTYLLLGQNEFDPVNVGLRQPEKVNIRQGGNYARNGLFILDTTLHGNGNGGHEFSSRWDPSKPYYQQPQGVIGRALSIEERMALIEYLKTL